MLRPLLLLSLLSDVQSAWCSPRNVTVDDELGDSETGQLPTYSPQGIWDQGATCMGCTAKLNKSLTFDGTWHDTTYTPGGEPRTIEINFTGTAVYTFFTLANLIQYSDTLTNVSFTLDNNAVGTFEHIPTSSTDFNYSVPVYVNESLENVPHNLLISAIGPDSLKKSLVLFDNLIYTADDENSSTSIPSESSTSASSSQTSIGSSTSASSSQTSSGSGQSIASTTHNNNLGRIFGGAIAAAVVLAVAIFIFIRYRRNKRNISRTAFPFTENTSSLSETVSYSVTFASRQEEAPSFSIQSRTLDTSSRPYLSTEVDGISAAETSIAQRTGSKDHSRGQELIGRIAWLEEEMDRLQIQLGRRNHGDIESLPEYSDIAYIDRNQ